MGKIVKTMPIYKKSESLKIFWVWILLEENGVKSNNYSLFKLKKSIKSSQIINHLIKGIENKCGNKH